MKTHKSFLIRKIFFVTALILLSRPVANAYDVFVLSLGTKSVMRYDGATGNPISGFGGALDFPERITFGPDGNLYVSNGFTGSPSSFADTIVRFNGLTGEFISVFVSQGSGGLHGPFGLAFGPDGNLYVSSFGTDSVLRYNGSTGAFIDSFASGGGLDGPEGLTFGPDGNLYVVSGFTDSILRYNGSTGAFIDAFVASGSGGLSGPQDLTFGPDGKLYVSSAFTDSVLRYNGNTGAFIDVFVASGSGDLKGPAGLTFGRDGNLYVANPGHFDTGNSVLRYDGGTGAFLGYLITPNSGGLSVPTSLAFTPVTPQPQIDVQPRFWDYGSIAVNSSSYTAFTVKNVGLAETLVVSATVIDGRDADQFTIISGGGSFNLGSGETLNITVKFAPTSGGPKSATLIIVSNDPLMQVTNVPLNGVGTGANAPPVVFAGGPSLFVTLPASVSLDGTVSDDGLPNPPGQVTVQWSVIDGPGVVTFADSSALHTTASFSQVGGYFLRLTASDGQLSRSDDVIVNVISQPDPPSALAQLRSNGTKLIAVGGLTDENGLVFRAVVIDPDLHNAKLQIEIRAIGTPFTNVATAESPLVNSGQTAQVTIPLIPFGAYHWQARTVDTTSSASAWISFGGNAETASDFTVVQTRSLTVGSTNPSSGVSITVSPNDIDNQGSSVTQFTRTYSNSTAVTLTAAATAGGNTFSNWTGCDSTNATTCNVNMIGNKTVTAVYASPPPAISLSFDGLLRDRVGQATLARVGDGQADGTFTVTLTGGGSRTVTQLKLTNSLGGVWDTAGATGNWTLGAATGLDTALLNGSDDSVNFLLTQGGNFKIFAADLQSRMFAGGTSFSLTATFSDGNTATANVTIPSPSITLVFNGKLRDRVGPSNLATAPAGELDGEFTASYTSGGNRTLTKLKLTNSAGGVWDTDASTGFWTLGVAATPGGPLLNGPDDSVNFGLNNGDSLELFAADFNNQMFAPGGTFTLTANFADGTTSTATVTLGGIQAFTLSVASLNPQSGVAITLTPNDNNGQSNSSTQFNRVYNNNTAVSLTAASTAGGKSFINWIGCDSTIAATCNVTINSDRTVTAVYGSSTPAGITLNFDGLIRDRVGQSNFMRVADGQLDGAFTVTLTPGSGDRTVQQMRLINAPGGIWDTNGATQNWTLGAAAGLDTGLLNGNDDSVNFPWAEGSSFKIFAADFQNRMFLPGTTFTLTVTFSDSSTATANFAITGPSISLAFDGKVRDRVGQNNKSEASDGQLDGQFTTTYTAGGNRTLTQLRLTNSVGGVWDTDGSTGFWTLGVATCGNPTIILNQSDDSVTLPIGDGSCLQLFASDFNNIEYLSGRTFTLTATFSDGATATASVTLP